MPLSIWELAAEKKSNNEKKTALDEESESKGSEYSTVIVVGSKQSGKSSLILRFLDRDEAAKPTVALEYTYGRRAKGNSKEVANIWELGGGTSLLKLATVPIRPNSVENLSVLIMIDLFKPEDLWNTLEVCIKTLLDSILNAIKLLPKDREDKILKLAAERISSDHQDKELLTPFPVPLVIIGGLYDLFQNIDPEKKRLIVRTCRFVAHQYGASLQFFSNKIESLVLRGRATVSHLLFNTNPSKGFAADHNKPVFVPFGADSMEEIGAPPMSTDDLSSVNAKTPIDLWNSAFGSVFHSNDSNTEIPEDPTKDPQFHEEAIDLLRNQKELELQKYMKAKSSKFRKAGMLEE